MYDAPVAEEGVSSIVPGIDRSDLPSMAVNLLPLGLVIHAREGEIVYANERAASLLGLSMDQLLGRTSMDPRWRAVDENERELPGDHHPAMACLRTGSPVSDAVMGVLRPDGERRWLKVEAVPLRDATGEVFGVTATFEDVTEQRNVREQLNRAEQRLALARRAGRVGFWEIELSNGRIWHDEGFVDVTGGLSPHSAGQWLDLVHEDDRELVRQHGKATDSEGHSSVTYRVDAPDDGNTRWVFSYAAVVDHDQSGRASRVAGSVVDATALQNANLRIHRLLDFMTDGYMVVTSDDTIQFVNQQAAEVLGRSPNVLVGRNIWVEFPDAFGTAFERGYADAMAGEPVAFEEYLPSLDAWLEVRAHPVPDGIAIYFRDVSDRRRHEEERERLLREAQDATRRLAHAATHDSLTGLANRAALATWLDAHLGRTDHPVSVLFVDLDHFKRLNDSHGHTEGDRLLVEASKRLLLQIPPEAILTRLGGDEFIIATPSTPEAGQDLADRIVDAFREPFLIGGRHVLVSASIGVVHESSGATAETLLRDADAGLHQAKAAGRDRVGVFDESLRLRVASRLALETDLRVAVHRREIHANYQPIYDMATGEIDGVEALARWRHEGHGSISPAEFIPLAEETGLVVPLGELMLDTAADDYPTVAAAIRRPAPTLWVNISTHQLCEPGFATKLAERVASRGLSRRVGIGVTETALVRDEETVQSTLHRISEAGFRIAIDDFGTGYSSLSRLANYPVDMLKIDRTFVEGLRAEAGMPIVAAIVDLAHAIGAVACAEGVETAEQLSTLRTLGVDKVSGFYLCRPAPPSELARGAAAGARHVAGSHDA